MEISYTVLYDLYWKQGKTGKEIAGIFGCVPQTIYNKMKRLGIARKDRTQMQDPVYIEEAELNRLYWQEGLSSKEIGDLYNCSDDTVLRLMIRYGIKRRDRTYKIAGWGKGLHLSQEHKQKMSRTRKARLKSGEIRHWNIGRKTSEETRRKISQSLLKGRSAAPSEYGANWRVQRTSCLQRDNYSCQQCGDKERLEVHHWEPYRFCFDNSLDNLVSLCSGCHHDMHAVYRKEGFIEEAETAFYA